MMRDVLGKNNYVRNSTKIRRFNKVQHLVLKVETHLFLHWPPFPSLSSCFRSLVYGFGPFWSSWVMPRTVLGLLWCWQGSFGRHRNGCIWSINPHCLLRCLWRERNSRCFEDTERSIPDLKLLFFRTLRDWLFALQNKSFPSFIDFLESCNFCIWFIFPCTLPVH